MSQLELGLPSPQELGRAEGHRMAELAGDKADRVLGEWRESAYESALEYCKAHAGQHVTCEVLREWCYSRGVAVPPSQRAWGGIMVGLRGQGLVFMDGYVTTSREDMRGQPVTRWRVR